MDKMEIGIWHNARCSKSRDAFNYLQDRGLEFDTFEYLKEDLTEENLSQLLKMLDMKPAQLLRTKEKIFEEKYAGKKMTPKAVIKAMIKYPQLIERPIIIKGEKAMVARPLEKAVEFLSQ